MRQKSVLDPSLKFIKSAGHFFAEIYEKKYVVYQLVHRDLIERYLGSHLGLFWILLQQVIMLLVLSFVLHIGLRVRPSGETPFLVWVLPSLVIWTFFYDAVLTSTNSLVGYSYIVKKINFRMSILPVVKIFSSAFIHFVFFALATFILAILGYFPTSSWFQVVYYFFAAMCFVLGAGWFLSAITVFVRDLSAGISVLLNLWFWVTPIYWNMDQLSAGAKFLCYLNPICYLVQGYRQSMVYEMPLWQHPVWTGYYWVVTATLLISGIFVFRKLKPHFADAL